MQDFAALPGDCCGAKQLITSEALKCAETKEMLSHARLVRIYHYKNSYAPSGGLQMVKGYHSTLAVDFQMKQKIGVV